MRKTTSKDLTTELCAAHTGNITGAPGGFQGSQEPANHTPGGRPDRWWVGNSDKGAIPGMDDALLSSRMPMQVFPAGCGLGSERQN